MGLEGASDGVDADVDLWMVVASWVAVRGAWPKKNSSGAGQTSRALCAPRQGPRFPSHSA